VSQPVDPANSRSAPAKAWGGVFREPTDKRVEAFSESVSFDRRLADDDIDGSIAHARMLASCGLMTVQEADAIAQALTTGIADLASVQRMAFQRMRARSDARSSTPRAVSASPPSAPCGSVGWTKAVSCGWQP
jgi:hypothetical protein